MNEVLVLERLFLLRYPLVRVHSCSSIPTFGALGTGPCSFGGHNSCRGALTQLPGLKLQEAVEPTSKRLRWAQAWPVSHPFDGARAGHR